MAGVKRHVHSERVKLGAAWLNGLSIAVFAVQGIAPLVATVALAIPVGILSALCFLLSFALDYLARRSLRQLIG